MTIRDRLRLRSLTARLRTATRTYAVQQLADYAATIDPTATWSRPMNFTLKPSRPKPDPALISGPDDIIVDGQVIGHLVAYQHGDRPRSYVAAINSRPNAVAAYDREPVHGAGTSPADAIAAAVAKGIAEKETALATLRALEARLEAVIA